MPKDIGALEFRIVKAAEVSQSTAPGRKQLIIEELKKKFIDPDTGKPIEIGEAVEVQGFDTPEEGLTWLRHYVPDVYKEFGWGRDKKNKSQKVVSYEPHPRDGKVYYWVVRLL